MADCAGSWYDGQNLHPRLHGPGSNSVVAGVLCLYAGICCTLSFYFGPNGILLCVLQVLLFGLFTSEHSERSHPVAHWLLVLGALAAVAATAVGVTNYHTFYAPYIDAREGREYDGIPATASAAAHSDAGVIYFNNDTILDTSRAVGLVGHAHTYCVAPILSRKRSVDDVRAGTLPSVQFWAVGKNCCAQRADFECNSAGEAGASGGIVMHDPYDLAASILLISHTDNDEYLRGVEVASALHELTSAASPVFVRWERDPKKVMHTWLATSIGIVVFSSILVLILTAVAWCPLQSYYDAKVRRVASSVKFKEDIQAANAGLPLAAAPITPRQNGNGSRGAVPMQSGNVNGGRPAADPFLIPYNA